MDTLEVKYDEEYLELILLCSLHTSYMSFRDTILYSHDTFNVKEVYDALFSKKKMKLLIGSKTHGEGLAFPDDYGRDNSKLNSSNKVCNYCNKKGT